MTGAARLVLASKSPARLTTLRSAGVDPLVMVSSVDEDAVAEALPAAVSPAQLVTALAEAKAVSVARDLAGTLNSAGDAEVAEVAGVGEVAGVVAPATAPGISGATTPAAGAVGQAPPDRPTPQKYLVVGCDSMLEIGGKMVGKPHAPEVARLRIQEMRGTDATLWTGHSLVVVEKTRRWEVRAPNTRAASTIVHFGDISDEEIEAYIGTGEPLKVAGSFTIDGLGGPFVRGVTGDPHSVVGVSLPLLRDLVKDANVFWPDLWVTQR